MLKTISFRKYVRQSFLISDSFTYVAKIFFNTLDFLNVTKTKNTRINILNFFFFLNINSEFKSLFSKCHMAIDTLLVGFVFLFVTPRRNLS